jgi:hypothetical protein
MNEAILAQKTYLILQQYLYDEWAWYDNHKETSAVPQDHADVLCELNDELIPVLEWLEKKFA